MKLISRLFVKNGSYEDSILIEEENKLIILNQKCMIAYDTRNY